MRRWIVGAVGTVALIWGTVVALSLLSALTDEEAASASEAGLMTFFGLAFIAVPATVVVLATVAIVSIAGQRR